MQFNKSVSLHQMTGARLALKLPELSEMEAHGVEREVILWCFILQTTLSQQPQGTGGLGRSQDDPHRINWVALDGAYLAFLQDFLILGFASKFQMTGYQTSDHLKG